MTEQMTQQMQQLQISAQQPQMQPIQVDISQLDILQGQDRFNFVGNTIYKPISEMYGEQIAGKITGMLLNENAVDYKTLLVDPAYLQSKSEEALKLIKEQEALGAQ